MAAVVFRRTGRKKEEPETEREGFRHGKNCTEFGTEMQVPKKIAAEQTVPHDCISELPEPILHYILSFVSIRDAAQTSVLSKRWKSIWTTFPYLNFGEDFSDRFYPYLKCHISYPSRVRRRIKEGRKINKRFLKVVNRITLNRCQQQIRSIERLRLFIPPTEIYGRKEFFQTKLDRWLRHIRDVKELDLQSDAAHLIVPSTVCSFKSINVLSLKGFNLMSLSTLDIKFLFLRMLHLHSVDMGDDILQKLILGCPLIEDLRLMLCRSINVIYLTRLLKLKLLVVSYCGRLKKLEIDAPGLQNLGILLPYSKCKVNIETLSCLRKITLHGEFVTQQLLCHLVSQCVFLDNLEIGGSRTLENIRIRTNTVKMLTLCGLEKLVVVDIDAPLLERFSFMVDTFPTCFSTCLLNASHMPEVQLTVQSYVIDGLYHNLLTKFLGIFNCVRNVKLVCYLDRLIIPKEKRDGLISPLYAMKHLVLLGWRQESDMKFLPVELVEYMLWLSPRVESLSVKGMERLFRISQKDRVETEIVLKFLYKESACEDLYLPCCKSFPMKCWRHCLVEVRIEKFTGEEDSTNVKNFFLEHVENLKIVET